MTGRRRSFCLAFLFVAALAAPASANEALERINIRTYPVQEFKIDSKQTHFGPLEFIGGLEFSGASKHFGALSGFRFLTPGGEFIAVSDIGFWSFGRIVRDDALRPTGFADYTLQRFTDADGLPIKNKKYADAEGLVVRDGVATVSFEREHRIVQYDIVANEMGAAGKSLDILVPRTELRRNRGFEALAFAPQDGPLAGALVAVTERSLDANGNIFAAVLDGPLKGVFTVKRHDPFDVSDGQFLPDGDLLLLERSFSIARGVGMRLRRIPAENIKGGAKAVDGEVLLEANMAYQIDNMEGLDVWRRADGATIISIMSDDNQSMLQRNLYLEFRLHN